MKILIELVIYSVANYTVLWLADKIDWSRSKITAQRAMMSSIDDLI